MFCLNCQEETNHVEIRPFGQYQYPDFKEEYDLGRFFKVYRPLNFGFIVWFYYRLEWAYKKVWEYGMESDLSIEILRKF